ncbi:unnamed protein product, partial [Brachionus calyciflorus]
NDEIATINFQHNETRDDQVENQNTESKKAARYSLISTILEEENNSYSEEIEDNTKFRINETSSSIEEENMLVDIGTEKLVVEDSLNRSNNEEANLSAIVVQTRSDYDLNESAFQKIFSEENLKSFCDQLSQNFNEKFDISKNFITFNAEEYNKIANDIELLKKVFKEFGELLFLKITEKEESNLIANKINPTTKKNMKMIYLRCKSYMNKGIHTCSAQVNFFVDLNLNQVGLKLFRLHDTNCRCLEAKYQ